MALIYAGVDGTGPDDDEQYAAAFVNSFVNTIYRLTPTKHKFYKRGPNTAGFQTGPLALDVTSFVLQELGKFESGAKVCLAGYSRGAAAVIRAAKNLDPKPVDYLVLFDAVDRSFVDAQTIPENVLEVLHAKRDPKAQSREGFSNCGLSYHPSHTHYTLREFNATHGGLGGTPWASDPAFRESKAFQAKNGAPSTKWNQKIEELTAEQAATANKVADKVAWVSESKAAAIRARTDVERFTNVTFEQDVNGAQDTWDWIAPQLLRRGIISNSNWPGSSLKKELARGAS